MCGDGTRGSFMGPHPGPMPAGVLLDSQTGTYPPPPESCHPPGKWSPPWEVVTPQEVVTPRKVFRNPCLTEVVRFPGRYLLFSGSLTCWYGSRNDRRPQRNKFYSSNKCNPSPADDYWNYVHLQNDIKWRKFFFHEKAAITVKTSQAIWIKSHFRGCWC